jgi:hypothetical protein
MSPNALCTRRVAAAPSVRWRQRLGANVLANTAESASGTSHPKSSSSSSSTSLLNNEEEDESCLWLIVGEQGAPLVLGWPPPTAASSPHSSRGRKLLVPVGEVVEARLSPEHAPYAKLLPHDGRRLRHAREGIEPQYSGAMVLDSDNGAYTDDDDDAYLRVDGADGLVVPFGGRRRGGLELWFARPQLRPVLCRQPPPLAPRAPVGSLKRLKTMEGRKVEAAPPLRALEQAITDEVVATLVDKGYAVVDNALPAALCRKLKAEMEGLERNGQMWNSKSYGSDDDGAPHPHINETQLDYKQVRSHAPTFARMEHDPSLVERMRGVPGLGKLASQHVRIQINEGHGGCYTMHTDSGTGPMGPGQTLCLTALLYLNEHWQPGDGGELRVFPFPHKAEVIAPIMGRLVLFEPRMVHDVLPNHKKRFCFTLWCSMKTVRGGSDGPGGIAMEASKQVDHETLHKAELSVDLSDGAAICERWRRSEKHFIAYDEAVAAKRSSALISTRSAGPAAAAPGTTTALVASAPAAAAAAAAATAAAAPRTLPRTMRALFLPEMRMMLVRIVHRADEIAQVAQSHGGTDKAESMVSGISQFHASLLASNPQWLLDLLEQLTEAPAAGERTAQESGAADDAEVVRPAELRGAIHRLAPWWIA